MARDYAKRARQEQVKKGLNGNVLLFILIVCMAGIISIGIYVYQNVNESPQQKLDHLIAQIKMYLHHEKTKTSILAKTHVVQQPKEAPEVRFNFYTELPNMQVKLPEVEQMSGDKQISAVRQEVLAKTKAPPLVEELKKEKDNATGAGQYILQLGLFKNETAAGQARISLLLTGCEAQVVQTTEGTQTLYRIQTGPYATLTQVKVAQKQLQRKGTLGLVKKL